MNAIKWMGSLLVLLSFLSSPLRAADMDAAQRGEIRRLKAKIEAAFSREIPPGLQAYLRCPEMQFVKKLEDFIAVATYKSIEADFIYYNSEAITSACIMVPAMAALMQADDLFSPLGVTAATVLGGCIPRGLYHGLRGTWAALKMSAANVKRCNRGIQHEDMLYLIVTAAFTQDSQLRFAYTGR